MKKIFIGDVFLYLIIILALVFTDLHSHFNKPLKTSVSTAGITSLAAESDTVQVKHILEAWNGKPAATAEPALQEDNTGIVKSAADLLNNTSAKSTGSAIKLLVVNYFVIIVYTLLLFSILFRSLPGFPPFWQKWASPAGTSFIVAACILGMLNNSLLLIILLTNGPRLQVLTSILYYAHLILMGLTILLCIVARAKRFFGYLPRLFTMLWEFRIVFAGLLLTWLILWKMDQGQDLLLTITSQRMGPIVSLLIISIFAVTNWYFPKYYDKTSLTFKSLFKTRWEYADVSEQRFSDKKFIGRLLGAAGFILPGICVLHAMHTFHISYLIDFLKPTTVLVSLLLLYYLIMQQNWGTNIYWLLATTGVVIVILISTGIARKNTDPIYLKYFALDFFLLSFVFLLFTINRDKFLWLNKQLTWIILGLVLVVSLSFLLLNVFPFVLSYAEDARYLTLSVVFSGIIFYILIFSALLVVGRKWQVQIITIMLLLLFVCALFTTNDYHLVQLVPPKATPTEKTPPYDPLDAYAAQWLDSRELEIKAYNERFKKPYPIFIVNAYGGGIRAAAWTSKVIQAIETTLQEKMTADTDPMLRHDFQHYVFAYSGASGGTIGSSVLCAQRFAKLKENNLLKEDTVLQGLYKRDFLTPVLLFMLGRDAWLSSFGVTWARDRGRIQEIIWEKHIAEAAPLMRADFRYDTTLDNYWYGNYKRYEVPLLFANSYSIDSGMKAISAPVYLDANNFPSSFLINNYLGAQKHYTQQMRLSTSSFLSARFPYISPEGKIDDIHHLMDGGLKENSGAETAREIKLVLDSILGHRCFPREYVRFFILSLPNVIKEEDEQPVSKNVFELTAPLTALMNNWVGNTMKADAVNATAASREGYDYLQIPPVPPADESGIRPVLPLGWQISDAALDFMDRCLQGDANRKAINMVSDSIYKMAKGQDKYSGNGK